jgi:SprB repeat/Secretion system C-terminal sorting domain
MKRLLPLLVFFVFSSFVCLASISLTATVTKACAAGTGQVSLTATGGITPYQYKIQGAGYQASASFTGLQSGTYTFYVKDNSGSTDSIVTTVGQVVNITGTVDTSIHLISTTVSGGTPPYQYWWPGRYGSVVCDSSYVRGSAYPGSLFEGNYYVLANDANGCTAADSFVVPSTNTLHFTAIIKSASCYVDSGDDSILIQGQGGVPFTGTSPYAYRFFNAFTSFHEYAFNQIFTAGSGIASATVEALDGDYFSYYRYYEPRPLAVSATVINASGAGQNDGKISLAVSGGQPVYTFQWAGSNKDSSSLTGLAPGTYKVTVTEGGGCSITATFIVGPPTLSDTITNILCYDSATGAVKLGVTGAVAPWQFRLQGGSYQSVADYTGLTAGTYNFYVIDSTGATDSIAAVVSQPAPIQINAAIANADSGYNDGSVYLNVSGGTAPYTYTWSNASTNADQYGLAPGKYYLLVTDRNGCAVEDSFTIRIATAINALGANSGLSLFPNPNNGSFILGTTANVGQEYLIHDLSGRLISRHIITSDKQLIQLSNLPAGNYNLQIAGKPGQNIQFSVEP